MSSCATQWAPNRLSSNMFSILSFVGYKTWNFNLKTSNIFLHQKFTAKNINQDLLIYTFKAKHVSR